MKVQEKNYYEPQVQKKQKKKRKGSRRAFLWIRSIFLLALFTATVVLLALSPLFNISKIQVKGSQHYKQEDVIATSGIIIGSNGFKTIGSDLKSLLTFRYGFAEKNILKAYPYVKSVIARFIVPGKVKISITERTPEVVAQYNKTNILVDKEAFVLEAFEGKQNKSLPLVKGLKFKSFEMGQGLVFEEPEAYTDVLKLIEQVKLSDLKKDIKMYKLINSIDVSDRGMIRMFFDSRLTINFGNLNDIEYKLDFCRDIIFEKLNEDDKGYIDMTTENPSFRPES